MSIMGSDGKTVITLSVSNADISGGTLANSETIVPTLAIEDKVKVQYNMTVDNNVNSELSIKPSEIIGSVQVCNA